jgi:hypothetical protein
MCEASYQEAAPPATSDSPGTITRKAIKVGNYILLRTLGKGSSSEVKLAQNTLTGTFCAVKVRPLLSGADSCHAFRKAQRLHTLLQGTCRPALHALVRAYMLETALLLIHASLLCIAALRQLHAIASSCRPPF